MHTVLFKSHKSTAVSNTCHSYDKLLSLKSAHVYLIDQHNALLVDSALWQIHIHFLCQSQQSSSTSKLQLHYFELQKFVLSFCNFWLVGWLVGWLVTSGSGDVDNMRH